MPVAAEVVALAVAAYHQDGGISSRENLNNREGQTGSSSVDEYHEYLELKKAFDVTLNPRGP